MGFCLIRGNSSEVILKPCSDKENLKTHFVSEYEKVNTASCSEPEASSSKVMIKSKPENQKTKVMNNSKSKAPELQILKRSEPNCHTPIFDRGRHRHVSFNPTFIRRLTPIDLCSLVKILAERYFKIPHFGSESGPLLSIFVFS